MNEMKEELDRDEVILGEVSPAKWIPLNDILSPILETLHSPAWSWVRNTDCKYINVRIDMRDGHVLLTDRNGKIITIDQLRHQYKSTPKGEVNGKEEAQRKTENGSTSQEFDR